jgi:hypothetical protein
MSKDSVMLAFLAYQQPKPIIKNGESNSELKKTVQFVVFDEKTMQFAVSDKKNK